jgi:hypothetical protein
MDALLIWYLVVSVGFAVSIRKKPAKKKPQGRIMPEWLAQIIAYSEPIEGHRDPLFYSDDEHVRTK